MTSSSDSALHWTSTASIEPKSPTLVFLHASWMSSAMFDETIAHLSPALPQTNLICVDLNGHGETRNGRKQFTYWDQADDVVKLMDHLKLEKAIFVGISMGASIALHLALSHPSYVAALVIMAATARSPTPQQKDAFNLLGRVWTSTQTPSDEIMNAAMQSWGGDPDVNGPRAQRIKNHWVNRHSGAENINAILQSNQEREDILPRLGLIHAPVLMVHGERDETYNLEGAEAIRDHLHNTSVRFEVIKESGHLVICMRQSEDVSMMIKQFVQEIAVAN
ncbi:alpha/beta-hydrolase [Basidiobolus meristosporus CBS 931.73]|uniref:Alpha/beta-hydrolase n=1 Tax=Basidiobolus meristosporus CBS 931.73 TaxID=1314790 RepID=A0A1Y1WQY8_9FUNG|nr:alpha/beta-hydrolase [Basidiobolus meristosporus CBS 931.73]ORX80497.1 alpha/beta-hydrolase [Basidiobolus meristosporus CBS 931.73]|eukprot:ORX75805.1 alpha/beta-hydrolase [Basidiobolus meristosporus CBS 931.73]